MLLKKLPTFIQEAQKDRMPDDHRPVMFMVQDEARFGRITSYRRCWAPHGIRPCAPHQIIRQYLSVFTAVAPQSGDMVSLIFPTCDTNMMTIFLNHISQQFPESFIVMQVDGASWHHSHELQLPENIRLLFQPPYSPETNPVEHIWDDVREKHFSNRQFLSLDALQDHLCAVFNDLSDNTNYIRSMTYFPHIRVACENAN
jgi:DDE superfamily endonuclease